MKIAYISAAPIPSRAANSVHVMKMAQALSHNGHDVDLLCLQSAEQDFGENSDSLHNLYGVDQNFNIHLLPYKTGKIWRIINALKQTLYAKKIHADLVFSRCLIAAWFATLLGQRTIFEIHDSPYSLSQFSVWLFKGLITHKKLAFLVTISQALKNHLTDNFKIHPDNIFVAADGSDALPAAPQTKPFISKPACLNIGYVGHLYSGRGIDIIAGMARAIPEVEFHIVGGAPEDIAFWQEKLSALDNITFHGFLPHAKATQYVLAFDILLAPYQNKVAISGGRGNTVQWMSPLKIFEYMATGKPMICSNLPVLLEVLEHRKNAWLCTPDNADDWINALNYLKNNPEEAKKIGATAKDIFLKQYTWAKRSAAIIKQLSNK